VQNVNEDKKLKSAIKKFGKYRAASRWPIWFPKSLNFMAL
jgi:hypothetical protein